MPLPILWRYPLPPRGPARRPADAVAALTTRRPRALRRTHPLSVSRRAIPVVVRDRGPWGHRGATRRAPCGVSVWAPAPLRTRRARPAVLARAATVGSRDDVELEHPAPGAHRKPTRPEGTVSLAASSRRRAASALGAGPYPINPACAINQHTAARLRRTLTRARGKPGQAHAREPARVGGGHPGGGGRERWRRVGNSPLPARTVSWPLGDS